MVEYSAILGNSLKNLWLGDFLPFLDMLRHSPFFWPGIVTAVAVIVVLIRLVSK